MALRDQIGSASVGSLQLGRHAIPPPPPTPQLLVTPPAVGDGRSAVASAAFTFSITNPASGTTTVTPSNTLAGTWTPATVALSPSVLSATATFTGAQQGPVNAIGASGDNGAASATTVNFPIYPSIAMSVESSVSDASLNAVGLRRFSDGLIGTIDAGGGNKFFYGSGDDAGVRKNFRITGTLNNPVAGGLATRSFAVITGADPSYEYAAGGTTLRVPGLSGLLRIYHAEQYPGGNVSRIWSLLGLARSLDSGVTWTDLGPIISPNQPFVDTDPPPWPGSVFYIDVGGGGCVFHGGFLYVYFSDVLSAANGGTTNLFCVARCSVADIVTAVNLGNAPTFTKYHAGGFGVQAGLGGLSSVVSSNAQTPGLYIWGDVAFQPQTNTFLFASMVQTAWGTPRAYVKHAFDPLGPWSSPDTIDALTAPEEDIYVSMSSATTDGQREVTNPVFFYYLFWANGFAVAPEPSLNFRQGTLDVAAAISAAVSGSVSPSATEAEIAAGGETIVITLTNTTWVAAGAAFDAIRQDILNGLDAASSPANGWNTRIRDAQPVTAVVRTSPTVVTITLVAAALYAIGADEVVTVTVPSTAVATGVAITATSTFTITSLVEAAALSGTAVLDGVTAAQIVAGGETIVITLSNATWVAAGAAFDAVRQDILSGLNSSTNPTNGWNNLVRDGESVTAVVRTSPTVVTITLSAVPTYAITAPEMITCTVPTSATGAAPLTASPTFAVNLSAGGGVMLGGLVMGARGSIMPLNNLISAR